MARRTVEEMAGTALSLLYIAGNLVDAKKAERILSEHGVDYALSLEPFITDSVLGRLLGREHIGLFISVPSTQHRRCRTWLADEGMTDIVPLEHDETYGA